MDLHLPKKAILMADISISKTHFRIKFPFLVILMAYISNDGTHNYQKRKILMADNYFKNYFETKFPFFGTLIDCINIDETHNCQKRKFQ